jgi:aspartyl-tRNA synthetase
MHHRYLDLRRPIITNKIVIRHKFNKAIRYFLDNLDFLEIETPSLSKPTPEGARDFLVLTRKKDHFFALPQSPQIYKQLLMCSGFEKYFQIAKVFRDEDSRKDRQPEFTQLDLEMSYANEEDVQKIIEKMFKFVFKKLNKEIKIPFKRINYLEAIEKYGVDSPDIRFECFLYEVTKMFRNSSFNLFKNSSSVKFIHCYEILTKKQILQLKEVAMKNGSKNLI